MPVRERDLDLTLLGALHSSETFRAFLISSTTDWMDARFIDADMSVSTDIGETDVLLKVECQGRKRALMIEHKIGAPLQPDQAERYRMRGEADIGRHWDEFKTCLCAPKDYIDRFGTGWQSSISLECIVERVKQSDDPHLVFLGQLYALAIEKRAKATLKTSTEASQFWQKYQQVALQRGLPLSPIPSEVSAAAFWPRFGIRDLPQDLLLEHKAPSGRVDLTLRKGTLQALQERFPAQAPSDVLRVKAGQSAALRIEVPRLYHLQPFEDQLANVERGLDAARRLLAIAQAPVSATASTVS